MSKISTFGKYLDQPLLISKLSAAMPYTLVGGAALYGAYDISKAKKEEKKKTLIKDISVLGFTVASALVATRGIRPVKLFGKKIFNGISGLSEIKPLKEVKQAQAHLIDTFVKSNKLDSKSNEILDKSREKVLKHSEVKHLYENLSKNTSGNDFLNKFIPEPKNITSKDLFSEIGRLSLMGLIPVAGGIAGGILGDRLTEDDWKSRIPNKVKEGSYQFLSNIFLCNVGAGAALGIMEKMNVKSKPARALGMIAGIILAGVVGGSAIANYIGEKMINPLFSKDNNNPDKGSDTRNPEALDLCLHVDDAATVGVMSGLRWIEPAFPVLYSISGYRAGIGYRNTDSNTADHHHKGNKKMRIYS